MDKLQYDSFYKFMVSAGVVLVAAPLAGLYYLLCNGNQILISQEDYEALSPASLQFVQQRDQTILYTLKALPWLLCALIVIGLICLIYGSVKWHAVQKELDEQTKLKTKEQRLNIKQLSSTEVVEKVAKEMSDDSIPETPDTQNAKIQNSPFIKAIEIENLCFSYIKNENKRLYDVRQNVRAGNADIDLIALSKRDNVDILYEIKYWPSGIAQKNMDRAAERILSLGPAYENATHRNWKAILFIVTSDEKYEKAKSKCDEYLKTHLPNISIQVISEGKLKVKK